MTCAVAVLNNKHQAILVLPAWPYKYTVTTYISFKGCRETQHWNCLICDVTDYYFLGCLVSWFKDWFCCLATGNEAYDKQTTNFMVTCNGPLSVLIRTNGKIVLREIATLVLHMQAPPWTTTSLISTAETKTQKPVKPTSV